MSSTWRRDEYVVSTDASSLDVDLIHRTLTNEVWDSAGISRDRVRRSLERSVCFGVYEGERQVGFARVVTDGATFAFVTDDFIVESHRGRGLAKWLMHCILAHPDLRDLHRVLLVTRDPRLYRQVGFEPLREPDTYMELVRGPAAGEP